MEEICSPASLKSCAQKWSVTDGSNENYKALVQHIILQFKILGRDAALIPLAISLSIDFNTPTSLAVLTISS